MSSSTSCSLRVALCSNLRQLARALLWSCFTPALRVETGGEEEARAPEIARAPTIFLKWLPRREKASCPCLYSTHCLIAYELERRCLELERVRSNALVRVFMQIPNTTSEQITRLLQTTDAMTVRTFPLSRIVLIASKWLEKL